MPRKFLLKLNTPSPNSEALFDSVPYAARPKSFNGAAQGVNPLADVTSTATGGTKTYTDNQLPLKGANGQTITRSVGFAILRVEQHFTIDEVVFAEPGDLTLLGARTLEGLSLVVDARRKKLVAAGPLLAA